MIWSEISSMFIMLLLLVWIISLRRENRFLKKENRELMKITGEYETMKNDAKEILKTNEEIKTIKLMREKYGLSLIDAKEIVDSTQEKQ